MLSAVKLCQSSSISGPLATQVREDFGQFVHHLAHRMDAALRASLGGQGHVDLFRRQPGVQHGLFQRGLPVGQRGGHGFAQILDWRPFLQSLLRRHGAKRLEQARHHPALAQCPHAQRIERFERVGGLDVGDQPGFQCANFGHKSSRACGGGKHARALASQAVQGKG